MSIRKPQPLRAAGPTSELNCPVCGKISYSVGRIHPQCAAAQAGAVLDAAAAAKRVAAEKKLPPRQPWIKTCPKCRRSIAARRAVCDCGHRFLLTATTQRLP